MAELGWKAVVRTIRLKYARAPERTNDHIQMAVLTIETDRYYSPPGRALMVPEFPSHLWQG